MSDEYEQSEPRDVGRQSAVVSYAFWATLFLAAGIYATVGLSPKLERLMVMRREHRKNSWHLVELERRVRHLEKVADALESDPAFAAELARSRFGAVQPGRKTISVSEDLRINAAAPGRVHRVELPWHYGIVAKFARNKALRLGSLIAAGILTLVGFGFLHTGYATMITAGTSRLGSAIGSLVSRYSPAD